MAYIKAKYIAVISCRGQSLARESEYGKAVVAGERMGTYTPGERIVIYDAQTLQPKSMAMCGQDGNYHTIDKHGVMASEW